MSMPSATPTPIPEATPERVLLRLDWKVIRRLDGLLQGDYRTLFYGFGVDFADLREYQPEDDIRYIDWHVTTSETVDAGGFRGGAGPLVDSAWKSCRGDHVQWRGPAYDTGPEREGASPAS